MNVLEAINYRMNGGGCPGAGSLGECAAITESRAEGSASSYHTAHLYLHSGADDLTPAEVASWFHKIGATDVVVSAVLYDKDNNILNGSSIDDGVRPWDVSYFLPQNACAEPHLTAAERMKMNDRDSPENVGYTEGLGQEVDSGTVVPGPTLYEVTYTHGHRTLKRGDIVRVVEDPHDNNLLLRADWTLHTLADEHDQYVHLRLLPMESRA